MDLIHCDAQGREIGVVPFITFDGVASLEESVEENDWEMKVAESDFTAQDLTPGDYVYFPDTEWGGRVEKLVHQSGSGVVKVSGVTWRGMLTRKILVPPAGQTHVVFEQTSVRAILVALAAPFGSWFAVEEGGEGGASLLCESIRFRYRNVLEGMEELLAQFDKRMVLRFDAERMQVRISVRSAAEHSEDIELSGDYQTAFTSTRAEPTFNHVIALGRGEQEQRVVRHLYLLPDGTVTEQANAEGVASGEAERAVICDYPYYEYESELMAKAKKMLLRYGKQDGIDFDFYSAEGELPLGDRVSIRDRVTGMADVRTISKKLLSISADGLSLRYSVV